MSEAIEHLTKKLSRDGNKLQLEISDMNQLSHGAESKWMKHTEEVEFRFEDDKTRNSEVRSKTDTTLQCW